MRATLGVIAIVVAVGGTISLASADRAVAGHTSRNCGIISKGSQDYRARALAIKCKLARRSSLRYLRTQEPRSGFDCAPTEGANFYCQNGPKAYWATRL